jgi:hypothetical protein
VSRQRDQALVQARVLLFAFIPIVATTLDPGRRL